jgi:hypothetical protein
VYEYICAHYGVQPDPSSTIMTDTPVSEEEFAFPKREEIPGKAPRGQLKKDEVWFPGLDYLFGFANLLFSDSVHYEIQIPQQALMKYAKANDGSPLAVIAAVMAKALYRALPKNKLPLRIETNHNYRAEVGGREDPLQSAGRIQKQSAHLEHRERPGRAEQLIPRRADMRQPPSHSLQQRLKQEMDNDEIKVGECKKATYY